MREVIEINGVKLDVDMRTATRVDEMKVGTRVRVLTKTYSGADVKDGIVIGFEPFKELPTIIIATLDMGYQSASLKTIFYNAKTADTEVIVAKDVEVDELKNKALNAFQTAIDAKQRELDTLTGQRQFFLDHFQQTWTRAEKAEKVASDEA